MDSSRHRNQAGMALIAVLLLMALMMGLAVALSTSIKMDTGLRGAYDRSSAGFYAAEAGLNRGMGDYRNIFLGFNVPSGSAFNSTTISVGKRTVNYQITDVTAYDALHNPPSITIPPGLTFGGLNSIEYDYIDGSTATNVSNDVEARVNAEFKVGNIPLFQFVAFYTKDMEIAPGPNMTLVGRVHTNGNLYLESDGSTLSILDDPANGVSTVQVSARGGIFRGRKRSTTCDAGNVVVAQLVDANHDGRLDPYGLNCNLPDTASPSNASGSTREALAAELATWKGSMINHIESLAVPQPGITARCGTSDCTYWQKADLRIVLNLNNTYTPPGWPTTGVGAKLPPYSIEVQDSAGNVDAAKTANLRNFMLATGVVTGGAGWNFGTTGGVANSSMKGTMPIFYTDRPTGATGCTDANATTCTNNRLPTTATYSIPFATPNLTAPAYPTTSPPATNANRVYATAGTNMWAGGTSLDTDYRRGGFYNWREGKWMYLLNINVHDLLNWNMQTWNANSANALFNPADTTDGGIVLFLSVQGPESNFIGDPTVPGSGNRYGVRIFGSATLPFPVLADPTGITIVSDQAIYVAGDYNAPNGAAGPNKLANGWKPASIIGDSINILSNNWFIGGAPSPASFILAGHYYNDYQSNMAINTAAPTSRVAIETNIDTAFLGGVDDTIPNGGTAGYNGGLENYPRFHEQWGVNFNYYGSFVSLGNPQHVSGDWNNQSYTPPSRNWNFETQFSNAANLPPMTPRFVYVQQVLFTEQFK